MPVLPAPCFVFSDAHLGVTPPGVERSLLGFLDHLRDHAGSVVINGDLFDFWFEWQSVIPRPGFRVLAALARSVGSDPDIQTQLYHAKSPAHVHEILHAEEFEDYNYFLEEDTV